MKSARACLSLLRDGRVVALGWATRAAHQPACIAGCQRGEGGLSGADEQSPPDALLGLGVDVFLTIRLDDAPLSGCPGLRVVAEIVQAATQVIQFELANELFGGRSALPR